MARPLPAVPIGGRASHPLRLFTVAAGIVAAVLSTGGCAATCREVALSRDAFQKAQARSRPPGWHAAVGLPYAAVNRLVAEGLPSLPPYKLDLGEPLAAFLPPLVLTTQRLELRPAAPGRVGLQLELQASLGEDPVFLVDAALSVVPQINASRELEIVLKPSDLETVTPRLDGKARDRLAAAIERRLPARARPLLSAAVIAGAVDLAMSRLGRQLHRLLRTTLQGRIGELAHLRLSLPPYLPIESLAFQPLAGEALLLMVRTRLPVSEGLTIEAAGPLTRTASTTETFRLVVPGATASALANWGMQQKLLPARFDGDGKPVADGPYQAHLFWVPGPRPWKARAWRIDDPPCAEVHLGGEPELRVEGASLELGVRDAEIERVTGSALIKAAVWLRTLFTETFSLTRKLAADTTLTVSGRPLELQIVEGGLEGGRFWVGLKARFQPGSATRPASAR